MTDLAVPSPYLVPFDGTFRVADAVTTPAENPGKRALKLRLENAIDDLYELQRRLYAEDRRALLVVFQGLDASGKDSTIRRVFSGVNPAGFQVSSFKKPSDEELDHDYLWRVAKRCPERGRIGIFNRSHYEEVLVVRVHPELLRYQRLPERSTDDLDALWRARYEAIRQFERHLADNGTTLVKFWLYHSREAQRERFLARLDDPRKHWKFSARDVVEREHWDDYLRAYEDALNATSRPGAPWYAIPADSKRYARATVARIVAETLRAMNPRYPTVSEEAVATFDEMRAILEAQAPVPGRKKAKKAKQSKKAKKS